MGTRARSIVGAVTALALAACSSNGSTEKDFSIPTPTPGKVAPFELGKLSSKYDINEITADHDLHSVASDAAGNVYILDARGPGADLLLMTPSGNVRKFASLPSVTGVLGITAVKDEVIVGSSGGLYRVNHNGKVDALKTKRFDSPYPIGARPDGSVIVADGSSVWALKGDKATELYSNTAEITYRHGVVDATGTVYLDNGGDLEDTLVLEPGKEPRTLHLQHEVRGTNAQASSMARHSMSAARGGGFYAKTTTQRDERQAPSGYVVRVRPSGTVRMIAKGNLNNENPQCKADQQYSAVDNACAMPWFVVESGERVLVMGGNALDPSIRIPALAIGVESD